MIKYIITNEHKKQAIMINPIIFKSYDIRGVYPGELSEESAKKIGRAIIKKTRAKKVVIARDGRLSSESLAKALKAGILSQGADMSDIGQAATEVLYFSVGNYDFDAGIMITASHNPKEYNGFKTIYKTGKDLNILRGVDLSEIAQSEDIADVLAFGKEQEFNPFPDYISHILDISNPESVRNMKVCVDAGNGMASKIIPLLKEKLSSIEINEINSGIDGNFPGRGPNPILEGASNMISEEVRKTKSQMGFMFDGDSDRVFLINEKGEFVPADITLLILARYALQKNPGIAISYNLVCSRAVKEKILEWGGMPVRTKVGFVNVRQGIIDNNGSMGGEQSGHYCFKENFYLDSGFIAFLNIIKLVFESHKPVSELVKELDIYYREPALELKLKDKQKAIEILKEKFKDGKQDELDGITSEYDNWWFNARASNTEPVLRITMEADSKEIFDEKKQEILKSLEGME